VKLRPTESLVGKRVLISGAARGIGAATARRLHARGARVALLGIEPELLDAVAQECAGTAHHCDVRSRQQVDQAVADAVDALGGLDVCVANAGVAAQLPLDGGDPSIFENTMAVNALGTYYLVRAAAPHLTHSRGYALLTASLAAAVHLPLMGAYSASKAAVEALGNTLRAELAPSGVKLGVAYFAELDTEMTSRGFGTEAAARLSAGAGSLLKVAPLSAGIDAIERGIRHRSRIVAAPGWVRAVLPFRMLAQPFLDVVVRRGLADALAVARTEEVELTTPLDALPAPGGSV
jgi:NAD(P)-dependent dehydrogenase (short-subunit alcohol dehydrogenase family)